MVPPSNHFLLSTISQIPLSLLCFTKHPIQELLGLLSEMLCLLAIHCTTLRHMLFHNSGFRYLIDKCALPSQHLASMSRLRCLFCQQIPVASQGAPCPKATANATCTLPLFMAGLQVSLHSQRFRECSDISRHHCSCSQAGSKGPPVGHNSILGGLWNWRGRRGCVHRGLNNLLLAESADAQSPILPHRLAWLVKWNVLKTQDHCFDFFPLDYCCVSDSYELTVGWAIERTPPDDPTPFQGPAMPTATSAHQIILSAL